jgi:5-methylcytosine-specific restriction enzyme A
LADLALLCSNCHRMIHRSKQWLTPDQLQKLVEEQNRTGSGLTAG